MKDNFIDDTNPTHITKKFWSYVKASSNSHRIPESIHYNECYRKNRLEQAELFNKFFSDQFSDSSKYDIPIDINAMDNADININFSHFDVCNLLHKINPNKAH